MEKPNKTIGSHFWLLNKDGALFNSPLKNNAMTQLTNAIRYADAMATNASASFGILFWLTL